MTLHRLVPVGCCLLALLVCGQSSADIALPVELSHPKPPPKEPPQQEEEPGLTAGLMVKLDTQGETRIVIPAKLMEQQQAAVESEKTGMLSPTRNVIAGFALSAAVAGVFLVVRRGGNKTKATASLLAGVAVVGAVSVATANLAPPDAQGPWTPQLLVPAQNAEKADLPKIKVEISEKAEAITLFIGKDFPQPIIQLPPQLPLEETFDIPKPQQ